MVWLASNFTDFAEESWSKTCAKSQESHWLNKGFKYFQGLLFGFLLESFVIEYQRWQYLDNEEQFHLVLEGVEDFV